MDLTINPKIRKAIEKITILPQEDLLLKLLESSDLKENPIWDSIDDSKIAGQRRGEGKTLLLVDRGTLLGFPPMKPSRIFTFDAMDSGRLYSTSNTSLMAHPSEILGIESEVGCISNNLMKWSGFRRLPTRPKRICAAEKGSHIYYEMHNRIMGEKGGNYHKRIVAFNKKGEPVSLFINGQAISLKDEGTSAILACGLIEDAYRRNTYLCSLKDAIELLFPLSSTEIFEFFALREAPLTPSGRRKALIHWVSEHLRHVSPAKTTTVRPYYRGITEFVMDGLAVKVVPNHIIE